MSQNTRQRATQTIKSAAKDIQVGTEEAKQSLKTEGQNIWQQILTYSKIVTAFIWTWSVYLWTMMRPYLSQAAIKSREVSIIAADKAKEMAPVIVDKTKEIAAPLMSKGMEYGSQLYAKGAEAAAPAVGAVKDYAQSGITQAQAGVEAAKGYAAAGIAQAQAVADAAVAQLPPSTIETAKNLAAQASAGASVAMSKGMEYGSQIYAKGAEVAAPAMDAAKDYAQSAISGLQSKAEQTVEKVSENAQQAVDTVNQAASDVAAASASASGELKKQPSMMTQIKSHVVVPKEEADREYQRQLIETALAVAQSQ